MDPSSEGIDPVSEFCWSRKSEAKAVMPPNCEGIEPERALSSSQSLTKSTKRPSCEGSMPESRLDAKDSSVMTAVLPLQMMPYQDAVHGRPSSQLVFLSQFHPSVAW